MLSWKKNTKEKNRPFIIVEIQPPPSPWQLTLDNGYLAFFFFRLSLFFSMHSRQRSACQCQLADGKEADKSNECKKSRLRIRTL
jgi:hypothetical protein